MTTVAAIRRLRHAAGAPAPRWFERLIVALGAATLGFGLSGMVLALLGWFRIGPGIAIGAALSYSLYDQVATDRRPASGPAQRWAVAAVVIAVASLVFNWTAAAEAYLTDGETGVIVNAARHLDVTGSLTVDAAVGPFADARVGFVSDGFVGRGVGGELTSNVPHLTAVMRAFGGWFGQTPLLALGAVFGAAALLAVYSLATRLMPQAMALAVMAALALTLPFVQASRAFYPEVIAVFGVFSGLALLGDGVEGKRYWRTAFCGMLLGLPVLARAEWAVLVIPIGLYVLAEVFGSTSMSWLEARSRRRSIATFVAGFSVPIVVAVGDASRRVIDLRAAFEPRRATTLLAVAAVVLGILAVARRRLGEHPRLGYADMRRTVAVLVAGALVVGSFAMFLRPSSTTAQPAAAVAEAQVAEGVEFAPDRSYDEATGRWLLWYVGPLTLVLGVAGSAALVWATTTGSWRGPVPFLLVALVLSFAAIVDAPPEPVQVLASRRLLVAAIPAVLIGLGFLAGRLPILLPKAWGTSVMAAAALVLVVPLLVTLAPVADLSSHRGTRAGIEELCRTLDRRSVAALFVETASSSPGAMAAQTVRGFCRVPAARSLSPTPEEITALADGWRALGRDLVLVSAAPPPGGGLEVDIEWRSLERTVESRPDAAAPGAITLFLTPAE